ncbi:MAG: gliding motility-associated C-terminal domain-containing protein, partial [Elusimicrobiota bacterium]
AAADRGITRGSAASEVLGAASVPAAEAGKSLGLYWDNGTKYVKLYGKVDPAAQTVSVQGAMPGSYQIRSLVREQGFSFDLSTLSNKAITPNGDGLNDAAVLWGDNPKDSAYSGKIFDLSGAKVADMAQGPLSGTGTWSLSWDGKAGGRAVDGGVYVYQIRAEDKIFNGTLLVIR